MHDQSTYNPQAPRSSSPKPRKSRFKRFVAICLLLLFMPVFVFGATVAATGTVTVRVQEANGVDLWIPMPALLFDLAVFAAPRLMPEHELDQVRREIAPYHDALVTMAEEIESIPAGTVLVEVHDGDEHVRIEKNWRSFEIVVDSPDADVRVSLPARLLSRSLDILG